MEDNLLHKTFSIKTFGDSMMPFFNDGDVIVLKEISFKKILVNDFLTFKRDSKLITHRVIYRSPSDNFVITKGDANPTNDGKVFPKDILGKVTEIRRASKVIKITDFYLFQSSSYYQEILKLKKLFEEAKIEFVFLKGLPIHLFFEKKHPERFYVDCDVLINKDNFPKVKSLFKKIGYSVASSEHIFGKSFKPSSDKKEITFYKRIGNFNIAFDIHIEAVFLMTKINKLNALYPQKLIDELTNELLAEKIRVKINGEYFPILSLENLIIYLALHLFHHNFNGYYRYELLNSLLKRKINWRKIQEKLVKYKLNSFTYPVFLLLNRYYKSTTPSSFLRRIKPSEKKLRYIKREIYKIDIFAEEGRIAAGTQRFKNIYNLSENNIFKKSRIFLNLQILSLVVYVSRKYIKKLSKFSFAQAF